MILAISGKKGSGKDTLAHCLPEFTRIAFADSLKQIVTREFGLPLNTYENKCKHRKHLITIGNAYRSVDPNFWIDRLIQKITDTNVIVTDVRFKNEMSALVNLGAISIRVERDGLDILDHKSETDLDDYEFDHVIKNNGTISDLEDNIRVICNTLGFKSCFNS